MAILEDLTTDYNFYIRQQVAAHPDTPLSSILVLLYDNDATVRQTAAAHPSIPLN